MRQFLRAFFHWSYSQFFIAGLSATGVAMVTSDHFPAAYFFFSVAGAWALIYWQVSEYLTKQADQLARARQRFNANPKKANAFKLEETRLRYWSSSLVGSGLIILCLASSIVWTRHSASEYDLKQYEGFLTPANDPDPDSFCSDDTKDSLKIFVGRNEAFGSHFPYTVLRVGGKDRIILDRDSQGVLALTTDILDDEGKVIVTFEKGHFTVARAHILDMERTDRSTLIVRDEYKREVLNVRYLNKNAVRFSGLLKYPGYGPIEIPKTLSVSGICSGNVGGAAFNIK